MTNLALIAVENNTELAEQMLRTADESKGNNSCKFITVENNNRLFHSAAAA